MTLIWTLITAGLLAAPVPQIPVEKHTLSNGLTVLLSEDHRLPVVAVEVRYLVGSAHERPGRTGFAHLFEHLMFQGSKNFDDEFFKPLEPIGARVNGTTSTDRTNYYEQVPSEYLERVLWLESDRMAHLLPALSQKKLDNQREVVKNERRQNYEDRPYGMVRKLIAKSLYPEGHPYRFLPIGSHADLSAANLDDVRAFFKRYYCPANAILTIVGDMDSVAALAMAERYFGPIPGGDRAPTPQAKAPRLAAVIKVMDEDEVPLARVVMAWPTPALYAEGDAALDILSSVLTGGKASRLTQRLVYQEKVAKDVVSYQASAQLGSSFVVQATAAPGTSSKELARALNQALAESLLEPPTPDEFARSLNGWRKSFFGRMESVLSKARLLSGYMHLTGNADFVATDLLRYTSLNPRDVLRVGKELLDLNRYVRVEINPKGGK